jgi:hypothetical protein
MASLDPLRQVPGLIELIDSDDTYLLSEYKGLASDLVSGFTCVGTLELHGQKYQDLSFPQYAILRRKAKSLKVLLDTWQQTTKDDRTGKLRPDKILEPGFSNYKVDLFTLAITIDADECLDVLIAFAVDTRTTVNWMAPDGRTPLMVAAVEKKWPAVCKLVAAGASFFEPRNRRCAFIAVLLEVPEDLTRIEKEFSKTDFMETAREAVIDWRWHPSTLVPTQSDQSQELTKIWEDRHSQNERGMTALAWLHRIKPSLPAAPVQVDPTTVGVNAADGPQVSQKCHLLDCDATGEMVECPRCHEWFCESHQETDSHLCPGTA